GPSQQDHPLSRRTPARRRQKDHPSRRAHLRWRRVSGAVHGPPSPTADSMSDIFELPDLLSERVGGAVLLANDEFFAPKENLIKEPEARWIPDRYTERGKWMDGWESRRRRDPGHDWAIVRLGFPGVVRGVVVDTSHFRGNFPDS